MIIDPRPPITGATRVAAVIGAPVRHSLSPALHNAAFAAGGLDWRFGAFEVAPGRGSEAVAAMRVLGIDGFAVTMPHKADVAASGDEGDVAARALRSVNTVVLREDGSTFGASTDGQGFVDSLLAAGLEMAGTRFAIIGAGGAARAIVDALGRAEVAEVVVVNRSAARIPDVVALAPMARPGTLDDVEAAEVVVNTTSVGMAGGGPSGEVPLDVARLHAGHTVVDIVYHPRRTALLTAAERVGADTIDGLGMLVHQAVRQQQLWTGIRPDPAVLWEAAEAELAGRA
ncbi:MAG: shikimate dehydrogenase [Ilumatobacteraceae bacterium]